eukprot:SAG22_NODE_2252_length_2785_cov_2.933730_3_plen_227_part_00
MAMGLRTFQRAATVRTPLGARPFTVNVDAPIVLLAKHKLLAGKTEAYMAWAEDIDKAVEDSEPGMLVHTLDADPSCPLTFTWTEVYKNEAALFAHLSNGPVLEALGTCVTVAAGQRREEHAGGRAGGGGGRGAGGHGTGGGGEWAGRTRAREEGGGGQGCRLAHHWKADNPTNYRAPRRRMGDFVDGGLEVTVYGAVSDKAKEFVAGMGIETQYHQTTSVGFFRNL